MTNEAKEAKAPRAPRKPREKKPDLKAVPPLEEDNAGGAAEAEQTSAVKVVEKATEWVMGKFTPGGIVMVLRGDHNTIEKASAKVNKEAKMRVAFVVDVRAVDPVMLDHAKPAFGVDDLDGLDEDEDEEE